MKEMTCFMVGGCVRDELMGREPNDIDYVVVGSNPEFMINNGFKQVGADFPVFLDENGDEFALARTERKTGRGYHGFETVFDESVTLEQDLFRRDLTVNAMAKDSESGEIFDPFSGQSDIESKTLRHVSTAFAEDPVRILRLARFNAKFGSDWHIAPSTKSLVATMIDDGALDDLTPERVWKEVEKAMETDSPWVFFDALFELGALGILAPELATVDLEDIERVLKHHKSTDAEVNFAKVMAMIPNPEDVQSIMTRWKLSNNVCKLITLRRNIAWIQFFHESKDKQLNLGDVVSMLDNNAMNEEWIVRASNGIKQNFVDRIIDSLDAIKGVNFMSLSEEQNKTLKGAEIAKALKEIKIDRIREFWKRA